MSTPKIGGIGILLHSTITSFGTPLITGRSQEMAVITPLNSDVLWRLLVEVEVISAPAVSPKIVLSNANSNLF